MRIVFDGRVIQYGKSGVGVYAESLLNAISDIDTSNRYEILSHGNIGSHNGKFEYIKTGFRFDSHPAGDLWEQIYLPFHLKRKKTDIFHSPTFHVPLISFGTKKVVTIHDLVSFRFPQTQPKSFVAYSRFMIKAAAKFADGIITSSMATKIEIKDILKVNEEKVHVVYGAPRSIFKTIEDKEAIKEMQIRCNLPCRFILFVGSLEPRKNIGNLIYAFSSMKKKGIIHKLILCGGAGWMNEQERLRELAQVSGVGNDVIFTGYVPDADLPAFYNLADIFVYPSLYEGFGLPPLEAMACGCPVITSNTSSLPEVVGDAAIMVNPYDVEGLADAMCRVLTNNELRLKMKKQGIERAKMFSWTRCAAETLEVYKNLIGA